MSPALPDPVTAPELFEGILWRRSVAYIIDLVLIGMAAMDIVLTPARGQPLDGWLILVHPVLFWVTTWISWPLSLVFAFFTPRRQLVHDLLTGTLMLRRSPMEQHWRRMGMAGA